MQKFRSGDDVISGDLQILRCVILLTIVSGVVSTSTSETTYLQYLNGTLTALVSICQFTLQLLYSDAVFYLLLRYSSTPDLHTWGRLGYKYWVWALALSFVLFHVPLSVRLRTTASFSALTLLVGSFDS